MYYQRPLYFRIVESFCRHWRLFAVSALTIAVLLTAYVVTRPKTYNSQYTVVQNTQTIANPLSNESEVVDWNAINQAVSHFQTVVQTTEFVRSALFSADGTPIVKLERPFDYNSTDQIAAIQRAVTISATSNDSFTVGMTYGNPDDSVTILKALINLFKERSAQEKAAAYTAQAAFIREQVNAYKDKLDTAQAKLTTFQAENITHMPAQQEQQQNQLSNYGTQIAQYQIEVSEDQEQEKILQQEVDSTPKYIIASQISGASPLDNQLSNLQMQLDQDLTIRGYKPNHPDVVSLEKRIKALNNMRASKIKSGSQEASGITSTNRETNPQYQAFYNQLMQLKISQKGLETQITDLQALMAKTAQGVSKVPEEERLLANLTRDYQINGDTYGVLVKQLQVADDNAQINLRQQRGLYNLYLTMAPQLTTGKSKAIVLFAGGFFLALLVAVGLVVVSEAMDRSFRDPFELQRVLGVPVLAMLPESAELHVADSKNPRLPGGSKRKLLGRSAPSALRPEQPKLPMAAAASKAPEEHSSNKYNAPDFDSGATAGAGGAAVV